MSEALVRHGAPGLPPLVRRYLERNLLTDDPLPRCVGFAQSGEMQLKPGRWLPFRATQDMLVDRVEFAWRAHFRLAPLVSLRVHDWYGDGDGALEGRLWGRIPVLGARGPEVARGEAMRYLAELAWVPQAMIANRELDWRTVDDATVEVATGIGGSLVSVLLHFDAAGDIGAASADARPRMVGKDTVETPFRGVFGEYREFGGVRLPTTAEVSWLLPDGPFTYFRVRVTGLQAD
jgi:hypothetical protein